MMPDYIISDEQRELFNNTAKCLCALLKTKGKTSMDVVPDFIYLYENGVWVISGRGFADTAEEILKAFAEQEGDGDKTPEELFDILIEYMEIDEEYLGLFNDVEREKK